MWGGGSSSNFEQIKNSHNCFFHPPKNCFQDISCYFQWWAHSGQNFSHPPSKRDIFSLVVLHPAVGEARLDSMLPNILVFSWFLNVGGPFFEFCRGKLFLEFWVLRGFEMNWFWLCGNHRVMTHKFSLSRDPVGERTAKKGNFPHFYSVYSGPIDLGKKPTHQGWTSFIIAQLMHCRGSQAFAIHSK